jgi:hypothetical protein
MRLWSIHPRYLDRQGLLALWREGLLAQKVLAGKTRGYQHHPQLIRFRETRSPLGWIGAYLGAVASEAEARGYRFDRTKIHKPGARRLRRLPVSDGQLRYESEHLRRKLKRRDPSFLRRLETSGKVAPHPLFRVVRGGVHDWERRLPVPRSRA